MILKFFTQPTCPKCPTAKKLFVELKTQSASWRIKLKTEEYDTTTVDGLAEASFYTVMATPTILLCSDEGKVIKDWRGVVPLLTEITRLLQ